MSRPESERLRDIKDAIDAINGHLERMGGEPAGRDDPLLHDALLFQFVVIGEAVKNLSEETRKAAPEIPWEDVAGLRDTITHEYFRIDMQRVLSVAEGELPQLARTIDRLLSRAEFDVVRDVEGTPEEIEAGRQERQQRLGPIED